MPAELASSFRNSPRCSRRGGSISTRAASGVEARQHRARVLEAPSVQHVRVTVL
jgi:hypothetical protein